MGKKIVRLTESDLARIVKKVIMEQTPSEENTKCDKLFDDIFKENLKNSNNGWNCSKDDDNNTIICRHKEKSPFMVEKYCGDPNKEYDYGFKIYDGDGEMFKKILVNTSRSEQVVDRCITFLKGFITYKKQFNKR
jgi:hypothetical protein